MEEARLSLDEANDLLSAWAWTRGRERGIRLLLIKGRTLSNDGLRAARTSADVDALVEPARFEEYCQAITEAGWQEIPQTFASRAFTLHSRSFHREGWPGAPLTPTMMVSAMIQTSDAGGAVVLPHRVRARRRPELIGRSQMSSAVTRIGRWSLRPCGSVVMSEMSKPTLVAKS